VTLVVLLQRHADVTDCEHECDHCSGKAFRTKSGLATHQRTWCMAAEEAKECEVTDEFDVEKVVDASGPPADRPTTGTARWNGSEETPGLLLPPDLPHLPG